MTMGPNPRAVSSWSFKLNGSLTQQSHSDSEQLSREAEFLHQKIFGWSISETTQAAYVSANETLLPNATNASMVSMQLIVRQSMDVEAIEFALRRRMPENILTKKLLILLYLTESRSDYFSVFVNEQNHSLRAFAELFFHTFRSFYKLLKGRWLIWMYDVV